MRMARSSCGLARLRRRRALPAHIGRPLHEHAERRGIGAQDQARIGADHRVQRVERAQHRVQMRIACIALAVDVGRVLARLRLDVGCLDVRVGHRDARVALGVRADLRGFAIAVRGALGRHGLALRAHPVDGRGERDGRQREPFEPDLCDAHAIGGIKLRVDLPAQRVLEFADLHLSRIGVHERREIVRGGCRLQRGTDERANLSRRFIRLVADRAHETADVARIGWHAPRDVGLDDDAQAIAGADVLQAARRRMQAQVDGRHRIDRRGQAPREPRFEQHAHGSPESRDHRCLAGTHLHEARDDQRDEHAQHRDGHAQAECAGRLRCTVMRVVVMAMAMAMVRMVMRVRMKQTHDVAPGAAASAWGAPASAAAGLHRPRRIRRVMSIDAGQIAGGSVAQIDG
ncbi:hypothetical protein BCEN4_440057 [Burkholderia cenocepacia]|nr:hypothetical protein BCEN4_440057 [Burkholderia cenocepacia]